jgi:hypothetical protein
VSDRLEARYRITYDWGNRWGWFVSTGQVQDLLERLGLKIEGVVERRYILSHYMSDQVKDVDIAGLAIEKMIRDVWLEVLKTGRPPLELPQVTRDERHNGDLHITVSVRVGAALESPERNDHV